MDWDQVPSKSTLANELQRSIRKMRKNVVLESVDAFTKRLFRLLELKISYSFIKRLHFMENLIEIFMKKKITHISLKRKKAIIKILTSPFSLNYPIDTSLFLKKTTHTHTQKKSKTKNLS